MDNFQTTINLNINTKQSIVQLQELQNQVNKLNRTLSSLGPQAAQDMARYNRALIEGANASSLFQARIVPITSSVENFTTKLEKNKFTMGEYTKYAASQMPMLSRMFRREFDTMQRVAEDRVRKIATQYVALGDAATGAKKAIALTPTGALNLKDQNTQAAIAAQKHAILNKVLADGSTKMLNWGKNTQWAGRQLMVGFSIPLAMLGTAASRTFKQLDQASISFKRVYGDLNTTTAEMERNLEAVKSLGKEYTKYGIAVSDSIDLGARVAATGAKNETLTAATEQTLRLATLGQMDYNTALDATISLQTAFQVSNEDLKQSIDFLNAVENQTVLTLQDMAVAIPRVAPVIKGLGGDVKDLAVFMTAMREGGVTAEQGANALKSGLASLINPTKRAQETLAKFQINLNSIIATNKGDLMGIVTGFAQALSKLDQFSQQQALEQIFGKYQYARMGALFKNIISDSGQAARAMDLAGESAQNLGDLADKELTKISEATSTKFTAAIEQLKLAISPIGEQFMKVATPILGFISNLLDKFNNLPDGIKNFAIIATAALAGLGPVILMSVGLLANGLANITKGVLVVRRGFQRLTGSAKSVEYLAASELEAATATAQLETKVGSLTSSMMLQQSAIRTLITLYSDLAASASRAAGTMPSVMGGGRMVAPIKRAKGGLIPGSGNSDTVPALLTPGESVVTKSATQKYGPIIDAMNSGTLQGFNRGVRAIPKAIPSRPESPYKAPQSIKKIASNAPEYAGMATNTERLISGLKLRGPIPDNVMASMLRMDVSHRYADVRQGRKHWDQRNIFNAPGAENLGFENMTKNKAYINILRKVSGNDKAFRQIFVGKKHPTSSEELKYSSSLIKKAQTYIKNNPNDPDVIRFKNTKTYQNSWDIISSAIFDARRSKTNKDFPLATPLFGDKFVKPKKMATGGLVPGKGNKDTIPALLTPGESIVTKQATAKYAPIISSMNAGTLRGFNDGETAIGGEAGHFTRAQRISDTEEIRRIAQESKDAAVAAGRSVSEWDDILKSISEGRRVEGKFYTNAIANIPSLANADQLTGTEFGAMLADSAGRTKMMEPLIDQIAKELGVGAEQLRKNPSFMKAIDEMASEVGTSLASKGGEFVRTRDFNNAFNAAIDKQISSGQFTQEEAAAIEKVRTRKTRGQFYIEGRKVGGRKALASEVTPYRTGGYASWEQDFLTEEGNIARARAEEERIARRAQYQGSQTQRDQASRGNVVLTRRQKAEIKLAQAAQGSSGVRGPYVSGQGDTRPPLPLAIEGTPERLAITAGPSQATLDIENERALNEEKRRQTRREQLRRAVAPLYKRKAIKSTIPKKMGKIGGRVGGALGAASIVPFMAQDEQGKFMGMDANMLGMGMMGAGMIGPALGPLTKGIMANPEIAALAAAAAITGIALYKWRDSIDTAARESAKLGANIGGTSNALNNMAQLLGEKTPAQRRTQMALGMTAEQQQAAAEQFTPLLESDQGKKFVEELKNATSAERFTKLSDYLKNAIAAGMMDPKSADLFAKTIASSLSDPVLGAAVIKSISGQRTGGKAMLGLAQERATAVDKSAAARALAMATGKVDVQTTSSVIGSSIQVIQDFSNAAALAKEQFAAGAISYEQYKSVIDQSTAAQEKYTQAIETSFVKTQDLGATMQAWKDQMLAAGFTEQDTANIEAAAKALPIALKDIRSSAVSGAGRYGAAALSKTGKTFDVVSQQELLGKATTAVLSNEISVAQATAITKAIRESTTGLVAETYKRTKDYGLTGLAYNIQQNAVPGLTGANRVQTAVGQQAYIGAAEKFKAAKFDTQTFQQIMSMANEKNTIPLSIELSGMSEQALATTVGNLEKIQGIAGPEGAQMLINVILAEDPPNLEQKLPQLATYMKEINDKIPNDVQKQLGINITNKEDLMQFGPLVDDIKALIPILDTMPQGAREFAINLMMKESGKIVSAKEFLDKTDKVDKAFAGLTSKKKEVRKQAIIDLMTMATGPNGEKFSNPVAAYQEMQQQIDKEFGAGSFMKLPPDTYLKVINFDLQIEGLQKALESYKKLAELGGQVSPDRAERLIQEIANLQNQRTSEVGAGLKEAKQDKKGGAGAGGKKENPLKDLMDKIKNQLSLYSNFPSLMEKLKGQKNAFEKAMSQVGYKGSFIDTLRKQNLSESFIAELMSKGYKNAKKIYDQLKAKGKLQDTNKAFLKGAAMQTISDNVGVVTTQKRQQAMARNILSKGYSPQVAQNIAGDAQLMEQYRTLLFQANQAKGGKQKAIADQNLNDFLNTQEQMVSGAKDLERAYDPLQTQIDDLTMSHRIVSGELDKQIQSYQDQIDAINEEIAGIEKLNAADENRIRDLNRQKEMIQRQIDAIERLNEKDQRRIESLKRQDEMRNRQADALNHELDIMSQQEQQIRDTYDQRIKALDTIASINDHILNQQKGQLNLAQALSQGDVYAAAQAAQEMQTQQAQFAADQQRLALQQGMENQIAGLTTQGGLTRQEAEAQIAAIKEQSYQTSLQIRDIEDQIYQRNQDIIPLKDQQYNLDVQIQGIQDTIYGRETTILSIQTQQLGPLQEQLDKQQKIKAELDKKFESQVNDLQLQKDMRDMTESQRKAVLGLANQWRTVAEEIARANKAAKQKIENLGAAPVQSTGESLEDFNTRLTQWQNKLNDIKKEQNNAINAATASGNNAMATFAAAPTNAGNFYGGIPTFRMATGGVVGTGGRDSIPSMLTPGEFVMRKAAVSKYGASTFEKMNMGAFNMNKNSPVMPKYDIKTTKGFTMSAPKDSSSMGAPVYNTYSINVPVNQPNATADEIANKVMNKIRSIENITVRGYRG